jgi:hypothetical protein
VDGHIYEGADRTCPACGTPQSARAHNCTHCGSVLDGAAEVRGVHDAPAPAATVRPRKRRRIWPVVLGVLAVLGSVIWFRCIRSQEAQVVVAGHAWTRSIAVEEFNERREEAWRNEVPMGTGVPVCSERQRSTRQVPDGGEECKTERHDKKDGTFEQVKKCKPTYRTEAVMDSWCRYTARRWKQVDEVKATGNGLSPAWPSGLPAADAPATLGTRRQGQRTETLTLEFADHGRCGVSDPVWRKYADGQKLVAQVRASSGEVVCSSL